LLPLLPLLLLLLQLQAQAVAEVLLHLAPLQVGLHGCCCVCC
jgi:hypothetical protein